MPLHRDEDELVIDRLVRQRQLVALAREHCRHRCDAMHKTLTLLKNLVQSELIPPDTRIELESDKRRHVTSGYEVRTGGGRARHRRQARSGHAAAHYLPRQIEVVIGGFSRPLFLLVADTMPNIGDDYTDMFGVPDDQNEIMTQADAFCEKAGLARSFVVACQRAIDSAGRWMVGQQGDTMVPLIPPHHISEVLMEEFRQVAAVVQARKEADLYNGLRHQTADGTAYANIEPPLRLNHVYSGDDAHAGGTRTDDKADLESVIAVLDVYSRHVYQPPSWVDVKIAQAMNISMHQMRFRLRADMIVADGSV